MIAARDLYWAAGLMEGEGYFGLRRGADLVAQLCMTDKDVVDRFHNLFGFGSRSTTLLPSGKIAYWWISTNQSQTAGLMMTLLSLMGERRAAKIMECLAAWKRKPLPKKKWTHCKNGHALIGTNLKVIHEGKYEKRRCIECGRLRQQKYRSSKISSGIFAL
jgi:hypothetical protein